MRNWKQQLFSLLLCGAMLLTLLPSPALAEELWSAMNEENKVSLFVQYIDLRSGLADTVIVNKHTGTVHTKGTEPLWR